MGLLLGVGGIMQELRRIRSGIQSEAVTKNRQNFSLFYVEFSFSGRHGYNARCY
jgi:tRNA U55 pseudouridine synthase TruB